MFKLGNHSIDEILYAVAQDFQDNILYTLDQLSSAQIEITSESTDITDKKGNLVRRIYTSRSGEFTATNAFLHPEIINASSGSDMEIASASHKVKMPKIEIVKAGGELDVSAALEGTIHVKGLYGSGANGVTLAQGTAAVLDETFKLADNKVTVPAQVAGEGPIEYLVMYTREVESGAKVIYESDKFPRTVQLTLQASYVDPCSDVLRPCYIYLPSAMINPDVTISFNRDEQEIDYAATLQTDYCGSEKLLFAIYYPDEDLVTTGTVTDSGSGSGSGSNTPASTIDTP